MTALNITNFKCFHQKDIGLNQLTILAGANGNGKSTVLQCLLFLRRTIEHCAKWENGKYNFKELNGLNVELNGPYFLNLGNSAYVLPVDFSDTEVSLGIKNLGNELRVTYSTNQGTELWLTPIPPLLNTYENNPLFYQEFYYLNAERIGPRITQSIKFYDYANVGHKGEYTAQVIADLNLDKYKFQVDERRVNKQLLKGVRFEHHINAWLEFILDGVSIVPFFDEKTHSARVEVQNSYLKGNSIVATNTGFGISYALPIIVSALIAKEDRVLIIENPEAHLHPSAQSKMGYFLGVIANSGLRIIIETHSDHIVNGVQLAVAKKALTNSHVTVNFFSKERETLPGESSDKKQPVVKEISITEKGELTEWPAGFFDQSQVDFAELFKLRKL